MSALPKPPLEQPPDQPLQPRRRAAWKRILRWVAAGLGILVILIAVAVFVLLRSTSGQHYLLRVAQNEVSSALGAQVHAGNFSLHWSGISPSVDLYNVVVYGAAPYSTPPLLTVDHIAAGLHVVSLLQQQWYLNNIRVDHPVLRVFEDAHGRTNLPQTKSSGQSQTNVFELGVRHAVLDRGEVYYNNRKSVLDADLHQLTFHSAFNSSQQQYSGTLSYRDGHLQFDHYNPLPHDLKANFQATPTAFTLQQAVLRSGRSEFRIDAHLDNYSQPHVQATYSALLDTGELSRIMRDPSLPVGNIRLAGSMRYQSDPRRPAMETTTLTGDLSSQGLYVHTANLSTRISDIAARYTLSGGNLAVSDLRAKLLGGEITGTLTMRDLTGATHSDLRAHVRGLSLADLKSIASSPSLQQVTLNGTVNGDANATWGKTTSNLVARIDATLHANAAPRPATTGNAVPLNGAIHAIYAAAKNEVTLSNSYLQLPETSVTLSGMVSQHSSLAVHVQSNNLHELETIADAFRSAQPGSAPNPLGLYGTASFNGAVTGSTKAPQIAGQLNAANLRVRGTAWRLLRTNLSLSPSAARLQNGEIDAAPRGRATFNLSVGLRDWSFSDASPFNLTLNASQLNVGNLATAAGTQMPVSGLLSANISAHGSELNPAGQGTITLSQAKVDQEPIQSATLKFQGTGQQVNGSLNIHTSAGSPQAQFTVFPKQERYQVQLQASDIRLGQIEALKARNLQVSGVLNLNASGQGTFKNPQLTASLTVPQLKLQGQTINGLALQAAVTNHAATYSLNSEVASTYIRAQGTTKLSDGYYTQATLDTQAIPVQAILALYAPSQAANISGQTELHATLQGPLKNKSALDAHITIPTLQVSYKNSVQIGAASPINITFANGILTLQRATLRGTDTDLQVQGAIPVSNPGPMSLLLVGTVNLKLAQVLDPDVTSSGQLRFDINSFGNRANPNVQGQVQIINASFASGDLPLGLQDGNGVLTLTRDRLDVTHFEGKMGSGTVTASGGVVYRPALAFDLALIANGVRVLYPQGVRETIGAHLTLTGTPEAGHLGGQVRLEDLSFTPDFDLNNFMNQFTGVTTPVAPAGSFTQNLQLDVALQSTSNVNLASKALTLGGTANLRVTGTAAQPVILGRVNLTGGDLIFNGNRYVLEGGTIDFVNPSQTEPNVNLTVTATVQQYNIRLQFQGPVAHLHTNYSSDPALPPADIINLLVRGTTTEAANANPAPGNLGAYSSVASLVSSQVTSRVAKIAGISQLGVDPLLSCNQQTPGTCLTVQQHVTSQIYVTFSTDVTAIQAETIQLQYKATPRVTISGTRDQNGGFGFDARINKTW